MAALNRAAQVSLEARSQVRENYAAYRTAYDVARHYRDEIVPLRKAISDENSAVVFLGSRPDGLVEEVEATGALALWFDEDPQLTLVRCQLFAVAYALSKGLDPDRPRHLTRSIILSGE